MHACSRRTLCFDCPLDRRRLLQQHPHILSIQVGRQLGRHVTPPTAHHSILHRSVHLLHERGADCHGRERGCLGEARQEALLGDAAAGRHSKGQVAGVVRALLT